MAGRLPARRVRTAGRLPDRAPACFESQADWDEYRRLAKYSEGDGWSYCRDCSPAYQDAMKRRRRCEHPGVVFVKIESILVGLRPRKNAAKT